MSKPAESARLKVLVKPKSSRQSVAWEGDALIVSVNAPPVEGKANALCLKLVAEWLGTAKSNLTIRSGAQSRHKLIEIFGLTQQALEQRIKDLS